MKNLFLVALVAGVMLAEIARGVQPLTQSTYTEIIHEANTIQASGDATPARVNDLLKAPNRVRTGPQSRAELTAPDNSITRVGANTVFAFSDGGRTLNLEAGSLLFHAPKGVGGGVIKSGGVSAAVLGTTLLASTTTNGGFRVIVLEGKAKITLANGKTVTLKAGQEFCMQPGSLGVFTVCEINLATLVSSSQLVIGFSHPLPSLALVQAAVKKQKSAIASGEAIDTGSTPGEIAYSPVAWSPGINNIAVPQQSVQPVVTTTIVNTFAGNFVSLIGPAPGPPGGPGIPFYNGPAASYPGPTSVGGLPYFSSANPYVVGSLGLNGTAQATAAGFGAPLTFSSPGNAPAGTPFPYFDVTYPTYSSTTVTKTTYPGTPSRGLILIP